MCASPHRRSGRAAAAGLCAACAEGAFHSGNPEQPEAAPEAGHRRHHGAERRARWYFYKHGGPYEAGASRPSIRRAHLGHDRVRRAIGCVAYPAGEVVSPGVVRHIEGDASRSRTRRRKSERVVALSRSLSPPGCARPSVPISATTSGKTLGNLSFNPISALTAERSRRIARDPETRATARPP